MKRKDRSMSRIKKTNLRRRRFLQTVGLAAGASAFPHLWIPGPARASTTSGHGTAKHLLYIRLSGGFRFQTCFNAEVAPVFNPFGAASEVPGSVDWGVGQLLTRAPWLTPELENAGLTPAHHVAKDISVIPCVDHEPLSGSADGNHQTGLERFLTGYVGGETGLFTMINYGLREQTQAAFAQGEILLPAIIMGQAGMGRGAGPYAAYRPPVLRSDDLDRFGLDDSLLPDWARSLSKSYDRRYHDDQNRYHRPLVDSYIQSREATKAYAEIFATEALKIRNGSEEPFDGISNAEMERLFGDSGAARNIRLALRLFHFGCPAVYLDQGGYDMHSGEEDGLPRRIEELNRLMAALPLVLKTMQHPDGGSYWDHTIITFGSEFSRTARGSGFNSARGSDHAGDLSTRWMSMPFMGGPLGKGGRTIGSTKASDLSAEGPVFSYRATMKTLMDALGADHSEFFPADEPFEDLF